MKRKISVPLVRKWIRDNQPNGKEKLALCAGCSVSTIEKMITYKYYHQFYKSTIDGFCKTIGLPEDVLFPMRKKK